MNIRIYIQFLQDYMKNYQLIIYNEQPTIYNFYKFTNSCPLYVGTGTIIYKLYVFNYLPISNFICTVCTYMIHIPFALTVFTYIIHILCRINEITNTTERTNEQIQSSKISSSSGCTWRTLSLGLLSAKHSGSQHSCNNLSVSLKYSKNALLFL